MQCHTVDIDSHVAEPIELIMTEYLEPQFRDRPVRLLLDEHGLEYAEIDGKKSAVMQGGAGIAVDAGRGWGGNDVVELFTQGKVQYYDAMIPASNDPHARIKWMNEEGIDVSLIYPTLGTMWEDGCEDPRLAGAYCRAYNNWILDFCEPYPDRLIPIAHIPNRDVRESIQEVKRTAGLGVSGFMITAVSGSGHLYGEPYFDPLYAQVQETGLPLTMHPSGNQDYLGRDNHSDAGNDSLLFLDDYWYGLTVGAFPLQLSFINMINRGAFDRFPKLKFVILETGASWILYWLERMEEKWNTSKSTVKFKLKPDEYFQRQCWISFEPDEKLIPHVIGEVGEDKFFWAADFPHADGFPGIVGRIKKAIEPLSEEAQAKILGKNAVQVYGLKLAD